MSRIFNGTTARLFNAENSDITAYPATIFFYAKFTSVAAWEKVVRLHNTTNDFIGFGLNNVSDMTATNNQSVNTNITDATNIPLDTWLPYVGVFTGTEVTLYSQDSSYNTAQVQTWVPNFVGEEEITIGSDIGSANFLHGKLAHLTVWSDELSAPNITSLIGGADPWTIDNANITRYWAFTTDSLTDAKNSSVLSDTDTTTDGDNPTLTSAEELTADPSTVDITAQDVTFQFTKASELANSWFNGSWWSDPWFGTGWFGATSAIEFPADPATVVITAQDVTFGGSPYDVTMDADSFAVNLTFTPASVEKDFYAESFSVAINATAVTFGIDPNTDKFIISNSTTFRGKNIEYGVDICYNPSTDLGYTVVQEIDIDSVLLDGIFGEAPQPYEIRKYVGEVTLPSKTVIEFDGTNWHIISTTNLGI